MLKQTKVPKSVIMVVFVSSCVISGRIGTAWPLSIFKFGNTWVSQPMILLFAAFKLN